MSRQVFEKDYWNEKALDKDVDTKYICDIHSGLFFEMLKGLKPKVLEIGCGVGRLMKDGYCGIDIADNMLSIAKERKPNCEFKLTDGVSIPYKDNLFNSVYSVLVFQHLKAKSIKSYVKESARVLKKDGVFMIQFIEGQEGEPLSNHYPMSFMEDLLKENGFEIAHIEKGVIHPQWTWVTAKKL